MQQRVKLKVRLEFYINILETFKRFHPNTLFIRGLFFLKFTKPMEIGELISLDKAIKDFIATIGGVPICFHIAFYQKIEEHVYFIISVSFYPRIRIKYIVFYEPLPLSYIDYLAVESGL